MWETVKWAGNVAILFSCQIAFGILEQRVYKVPYKNDYSHSHDMFKDQITPFAFQTALTALVCYCLADRSQLEVQVPSRYFTKIAGSDTVLHICFLVAMQRTSYTSMIVISNLSLLAVVIVAAFFSGVNHRSNSSKIGPQKIIICLIICAGVSLFSGGGDHTTTKPQHQGGPFVTVALFGIALVLSGFRPDFAAQLRNDYAPSAMLFSFGVHSATAFMVMFIAIFSGYLLYFIRFLVNHSQILYDMFLYCLFFTVSNIQGYKIVATSRQHVYPMLITTRKAFTICFNMYWYGHHATTMEWLGIVLVLTGTALEIAHNNGLFDIIFRGQRRTYTPVSDEAVSYSINPEKIVQASHKTSCTDTQ